MKSLLTALTFLFAAPACVVHTHEPDVEVRRVAVSFEARRCHPSRYWNGERCVKKGHAHRHRHHHD